MRGKFTVEVEKLNKFWYFREAHDPRGLESAKFNMNSAIVAT